MNALAFAQQNLFGPLGIADVYWPANPDGISHGWGNMHLKPHDLAKIGYLYLDGGRWEGEQIIPADWVEASTRIHIETVRTDGLSEGYGYQWWIDDGGYWAVRGTGGQFIFVVPHLNLVAVFTGELSDTLYPAPDRLLNEYIIPAAE